MSGHSKWAKIRRKKGATDAKRGQAFSKHSKLIAIAAKNGPDPINNPSLAMAIENAKKDHVPSANIDRAVKTGAGLDKDASAIEEIIYEGYGPSGVAIMVSALTDNRNRAAAEIRHLFTRCNGSLGTPGSVAFQFEKRGLIEFQTKGKNEDEIMEIVINAGATDFEYGKETSIAYTQPAELNRIRIELANAGLEIESAKIIWHPKNTVAITDPEVAKKIINFVDALDDLEDVNEVTANFNIADNILDNLD
ncbi:MAG: YebC/PmpR family DNA-binding transcriptional regulator [Patescibacteria group bacterium]|nr:YebC/PmpR family DNA-binding transcriptional regulator [Patescibacteria group bacterium]